MNTRSDSGQLHFIDHVNELKRRLSSCVLALLIGSGIGYAIRDIVLRVIIAPLNQPLFYSAPAGGFQFTIKLSLLFGVIVSIPVFLYHIIRFVEPIINQDKRRALLYVIIVSYLLVICGILFGYVVCLPPALKFFAEFNTDQVHSLISTDEYLSFVMTYLMGLALVFQMPLVLLFINKITAIRAKLLIQKFPYVILISFVISAIITPTGDPFNQALFAAPIILLYGISLILIWLTNRRRR